MKRGNACHSDYSQIMGNSQKVGVHDCVIMVGNQRMVIPSGWVRKDGRYKKRFSAFIKAMIRSMYDTPVKEKVEKRIAA